MPSLRSCMCDFILLFMNKFVIVCEENLTLDRVETIPALIDRYEETWIAGTAENGDGKWIV